MEVFYYASSNSTLLETAFDVFNKVYFENSLPKAVITIQSSPKSFGYITVHKVWKDSEDSYHEINIGAEYLSRPIENVLATLMHEMVHLYCLVNGIRDTSNGGRYHNKRFKAEAEKRDLKIEYAQYIGYSVTSPTDRFIEVTKKNGLCAEIDHCRTTGSVRPLLLLVGWALVFLAAVLERRNQVQGNMSVSIAGYLSGQQRMLISFAVTVWTLWSKWTGLKKVLQKEEVRK